METNLQAIWSYTNQNVTEVRKLVSEMCKLPVKFSSYLSNGFCLGSI